MSDRWTLQNDDRLFVSARFGWARLLIGLPFLLMGAWFLVRYFVLGIAAYVRAGDWAGLFSHPLGWLVILLMGGIFLVPGWLIVFLRRAMLIDRGAGVAIEMTDFRVFRKVKRHPLEPFHQVLTLHEKIKDSSRWHESVYLVRRDESSLLIGIFEREPDAEALAAALSDLLGLPRKTADEDEWRAR